MFQILTLVLFDISYSYPRIDRHRDVYEVQEDKPSNTIRFVNPRGDNPVVREITYYHLVETPYDATIGGHKQIGSSSSSEEATERPTTNGHGYPLLDLLPEDADDETISETSKELGENESSDEIVSADYFIAADEVIKTPEVDQNQPTSDESTKDESEKSEDDIKSEVPADEETIEDIILAVIEEDKNNAEN
ncbi:unnamed protein product [Plutella xylostella]|uniref:(diamondback moth) hypothetical protein n=1 Tax=Plutella xylostella TaxID=51655 RepID=A0A8S4G8X5_PLUXY|nr:unnamed protein product [Plutella xylostella]